MYYDISGVPLTPGNGGENCYGNGLHRDENGKLIELKCDECRFQQCCESDKGAGFCMGCSETLCPHNESRNEK